MVVVCYHTNRNTKTEMGTRLVGYCCDEPDDTLGRTVEGAWNFELEKSLSVWSLMRCRGDL